MFEMKVQVRYSEVDQFGIVKTHQLLEYFQDCGTFQSISLGFGMRGDTEENRAWYLLAWDIKVERYPKISENLTVITEPYKMKGFYGYRRYRIIDEKGCVIVKGDSIWILMDIAKMIPVKIPDYIIKGYISEKVDETITVKRKLPVKAQWEEKEVLKVSRIFLDSNQHVNNAYYVLWAEDLLPQDFEIGEVKVDYRQSAFLNDTIHVFTAKEEDRWRIKYMNQDETLIAMIDMIKK